MERFPCRPSPLALFSASFDRRKTLGSLLAGKGKAALPGVGIKLENGS